jgi:glutamate dehydrogenase
VRRGVRWLLRNRRHHLTPSVAIPEFREGVEKLRQSFPELLRGRAQELFQSRFDHYREAGVEEQLAARVAGSLQAYSALGILQASAETDAPLLDVAALYFELGERLELDWFSSQILASKVDNEWQALARDTYLEDLEWQQRSLTVGALRHRGDDGNLLACLQRWEEHESDLLERWLDMLSELHASVAPDFAMFAVANRELLDLAQSSLRD